MPTYEYACKSCGEHLEVQQRFTDDPLTECPSCDGPLRKVFGNVGIAFKGSGFYKTDSRGSSKSSAGDTKSETKSESKTDGSSSTGGSSTPAAPASSTPSTAAAS